MTWDTWSQIGLVALVDAINPPVLVLLILVLGRPHALRNGIAYSVGMWGTHLAGGFIFAGGMRIYGESIRQWLTANADTMGLFEAVLGLGILTMAILMEAHPNRGDQSHKWTRAGSGVLGWGVIGFGITMTKLPIAVLYAGSMSRVALRSENSFEYVAAILYYNIIAFLPFFLIWAIWILWRKQSQRILGEINELIRAYAQRITKYGLMAVGVFLLVDGLMRYYGQPIFGGT